MIYAKSPIEQIDIDMSEDWSHVVATGHTANADDTAFMSMPLRPECFDGDAQEAFEFTSALLRAWMEAFGGGYQLQ
ncbi:hypothetical protein EN833_23345 [Mesorhizobium sp. M4B.F.Ca.ET.190.01.1.1]|uniref:hypothetical protein n=1 Tax=unclassified Mesorhizobium TaxID=325217 RepID=UPI001092F466|nr:MULTISPECIES: hypothetical protein [unclassified Mesorhizobium]TGR05410.1 hypothetical protein EN843_23335 [Mesorhizobium sp. M4B.F.Ca.ET.200.01.1.1]TGS15666.1 hypothetical protein EN833_23345 [Mesorhizobium sp. M4B.F.Ca.ET.190.01.1.1]TGT27726.1 hypothetical protein EN815_23320 [Mesorhizobium sp. M4B.F.Ca.ET.172.01.1.1]